MITDRSTYPGNECIKKEKKKRKRSMKEERKIKKQGVRKISVKEA
jgi:hypothetical protein